MIRRLAIPAAFVCLLAPALSHAQPVGPRFPVNQFVVGDQGGPMSCGYYKRRPQDVASDAAGNFVVVWQDGGYGYPSNIMARRYDRFGIPQDAEFQVSGGTPAYNRTPSVAMDPGGDFVIAWNGYTGDGSDVFARRFGANGSAQGQQFQVSDNGYLYGGSTYPYFRYSYVQNPEVDKDAAGNFIVVWQRYSSDPLLLGDADDQQIMAHRFNAAGVSQGARFKVSDGSNQSFYLNSQADVAAHADGSFVVAWKALSGGGQATLGRRFDAGGAPLGGEFGISSTADFFEATPDVETDGSGGFVVVWGSSSIDAGNYPDMDVAARRFDASGTPLAPEFRVNTSTIGYQCGPSLARLDNGNFVVTWHHPLADPLGNGYGQVLDAVGNPVGGEFILDTTDGYVNGTAVASQQNDFVVVWSDGGNYHNEPDGDDVFGQRFGTTAAPSCSPTPLTTCRQQTRRAGVLRFNEKENPARSRLTWVWSRGEATSHADFGDPFDDASYAFCLYDGSGAPQPLATLVAPRGNFCGRIECWRQLGGAEGTIQWVNNAGNFYGLTQIRLRPGAEGAAKITVTARGLNLALPPTPLTAPVVFQAQATNGECWSAEYDALITRNADGVFKANPTVP